MKVLVTGGAGFIGRWVVRKFLDQNHTVLAIDNLSNGSESNISEFKNNQNFEFVRGDILNSELLKTIFSKEIDLCVHLAAQIEVQDSLENPQKSFENNLIGTYNILEGTRKNMIKVVVVGTCMVYDMAKADKPINEEHPTKPTSPYAATKLAADELALSYYYAYNLPVVVVRPFNTYGPFQKTNTEGGVVSIFINRSLKGETLNIFGDGTQTRDFLYVEDCANFIYESAITDKGVGEIINVGSGKDISINELALMICKDKNKIRHIPHHHPQSEVRKLVCGYSKAKRLLGWEPKTTLREGIRKTITWIKENEI